MTDIVAELRRAHPQSEDGELRHRAADTIERMRAALKRMLLEFDFMVEAGIISDVRNDIIFVEARAALKENET